MKYIAPVDPPSESSAGRPDQGPEDHGDAQIVDLTRADRGVQAGSRCWIGVLLGIAVAVTGFGFICHGSAPQVDRIAANATADASHAGPTQAPAEVAGPPYRLLAASSRSSSRHRPTGRQSRAARS
jgi:hypothetical protein